VQGKNTSGITNINLLNLSGITSNIKNFADTSVNSFYYSAPNWINKQFYNSSSKDVRSIILPVGSVPDSGITSISNIVFKTSSITKFNLKEYGSCCFCSVNPSCIDYVTRAYCTSVGGEFSLNSCAIRKTNSDRACFTLGACCKGVTCINLTESECSSISGTYTYGKLCSSVDVECP
jgi:hypothetical protein